MESDYLSPILSNMIICFIWHLEEVKYPNGHAFITFHIVWDHDLAFFSSFEKLSDIHELLHFIEFLTAKYASSVKVPFVDERS